MFRLGAELDARRSHDSGGVERFGSVL